MACAGCSESDFEIQEAASRAEAIELVRDIGSFDVAIVDMRRCVRRCGRRRVGPRDAIRALLRSEPGIGIVAHGERAERHLASAALQAGATAYVSRTAGTEELRRAVRAAASTRSASSTPPCRRAAAAAS